MPKRTLTDRLLRTLKPAKPGQRYEIMDAIVPGLAIRVTDTGKRTFVLITRYPGAVHPARRALGEFGEVGL
ncbi:MAG: integrase, partial [Xanthobacteraceae bacterium]